MGVTSVTEMLYRVIVAMSQRTVTERGVWWFLESREEHFEKTETQITQIAVKL